jgi:transposase
MDIDIVGIDLGKNSCSSAGLDASGRVVLRCRMRRTSLESFVTNLGRCIVAMEACCGAHHPGRVFAARGHEVRLMFPEYVRPYVKAQKNGGLDAEAIAEAATRPTMRFVEVKSQAQSLAAVSAKPGPSGAAGTWRGGSGWPPAQMTTGGKPRLLGISKRGNRYLRKNLIHGARAVPPYLVERWVRGLLARAPKNVAVVALANKLARIAWAGPVRIG